MLLAVQFVQAAPLAKNPQPIHEAFVPRNRDLTPQQVINKPPPAPIAETPPPQPFPQTVWIPGYWFWMHEKQDFVWICGVWRLPPPDHAWLPGIWKEVQEGWTYACGAWMPDQAKAPWVYSKNPPPSSQNENAGKPPSREYFWFSGFWELASSAGKFQWLSGSWQKFDSKWILEPAHWIWRPEGYLLVPVYWDWHLDQRGQAYDCASHAILDAQFIASQLIYSYPDYLCLCNYYWFYYPHFWDGCDCVPPWWGWWGWWSIPWDGQWSLWWWWTHNGFPAPWWLPHDVIVIIPGPSPIIIELFSKFPVPWFITPFGVPSFDMWLEAIGKDKPPLLTQPERERIIDKITDKFPPRNNERPGGANKPDDVPTPQFPGRLTPGAGPAILPGLPSATFPTLPEIAPIPDLPNANYPSIPPQTNYLPSDQGNFTPSPQYFPENTPYIPYDDRIRDRGNGGYWDGGGRGHWGGDGRGTWNGGDHGHGDGGGRGHGDGAGDHGHGSGRGSSGGSKGSQGSRSENKTSL